MSDTPPFEELGTRDSLSLAGIREEDLAAAADLSLPPDLEDVMDEDEAPKKSKKSKDKEKKRKKKDSPVSRKRKAQLVLEDENAREPDPVTPPRQINHSLKPLGLAIANDEVKASFAGIGALPPPPAPKAEEPATKKLKPATTTVQIEGLGETQEFDGPIGFLQEYMGQNSMHRLWYPFVDLAKNFQLNVYKMPEKQKKEVLERWGKARKMGLKNGKWTQQQEDAYQIAAAPNSDFGRYPSVILRKGMWQLPREEVVDPNAMKTDAATEEKKTEDEDEEEEGEKKKEWKKYNYFLFGEKLSSKPKALIASPPMVVGYTSFGIKGNCGRGRKGDPIELSKASTGCFASDEPINKEGFNENYTNPHAEQYFNALRAFESAVYTKIREHDDFANNAKSDVKTKAEKALMDEMGKELRYKTRAEAEAIATASTNFATPMELMSAVDEMMTRKRFATPQDMKQFIREMPEGQERLRRAEEIEWKNKRRKELVGSANKPDEDLNGRTPSTTWYRRDLFKSVNDDKAKEKVLADLASGVYDTLPECHRDLMADTQGKFVYDGALFFRIKTMEELKNWDSHPYPVIPMTWMEREALKDKKLVCTLIHEEEVTEGQGGKPGPTGHTLVAVIVYNMKAAHEYNPAATRNPKDEKPCFLRDM